jgi:hypothetical protein
VLPGLATTPQRYHRPRGKASHLETVDRDAGVSCCAKTPPRDKLGASGGHIMPKVRGASRARPQEDAHASRIEEVAHLLSVLVSRPLCERERSVARICFIIC